MSGTHKITRYICTGCKQEFFRPKDTGARGRQRHGKFCTPKCFYTWVTGRRIAKSRQTRIKLSSRVYYNCKQCGVETSSRPYIRNQFCSKKCYVIHKHEQSLRVYSCEGCGVRFQKRSSSRIRRRVFCTIACFHRFNVGSNNLTWRGKRHHERGPTWRPQSRKARERDGHCCVGIGCGVKSRKGQLLSVDHIVAYRLALTYVEATGIDPNDLRNLACLCRSCHSKKTILAESRLLRGDLVGFETEAKKYIPAERIDAALLLFGLKKPSQKVSSEPAREEANG